MLTPLALGLIGLVQTGYTATFADVWDRWRQVDELWGMSEARARRDDAMPFLKTATPLILSARWSDACRHLDQAASALRNAKIRPEQAAALRFKPPVAEPRKAARLVVSWTYKPADAEPLSLRIGNRTATIYPGRSLTLEVVPDRLEPELNQNPELGVPLTAQLGKSTRVVYLSILKSARKRIDALVAGPEGPARDLGIRALTSLESGISDEAGVSLMSAIQLGESLAAGHQKLEELDSIPLAVQGSTRLSVSLPKDRRSPALTLVIGVSGFGGESAFAGNFGQGLALEETRKRGWAFVGASASDSCVADTLRFVQDRLKRRVARYFVLGYGSGAGPAMAAGALPNRPHATALMAPIGDPVPKGWLENPLWFAAGKEDPLRLGAAIQAVLRELGERKDAKFAEFEGIEHLMLPQEAIPKAFEFFDGYAGG